MTKINKLGKSTFVIAILSFLLVAVLAFGGTYAYFSAQSALTTGSITTGNLNIGDISSADGLITSNALKFATTVAQPNQMIVDDTFSATATGNIAYFTRIKFEVELTHSTEAGHDHAKGESCADVIEKAIEALVITTTNEGWQPGSTTATGTADKSSAYYYKLAFTAADATDKTEEFAVKIQLEDFLGRAVDGTAERCPYWMDAEITINITFEVLQADYLNDATGIKTATNFTSGTEAEAAWLLALAQTNVDGTEEAPAQPAA